METSASAFKFDRASKGLAAQVTCPHCGRVFPHALNKKNADKVKPSPPEPVNSQPAQVITVRATDLPEQTPEKGKPVFGPLAGSPRSENTVPPGGWEASAPPDPKPAFAPAPAAKPVAPFSPLPLQKPASPSRPELLRKPMPSPQTQAIMVGGKKKLPEWAQYLLLGGGILVIGIVIFALPFGESESDKKKSEPTPKKKDKDKDKAKPPPTQLTPPPPPGKKLEVAPRPRTPGTPQPGDG